MNFLSWMAWTWQVALLFVIIFLSIIILGIVEKYYPGGGERKGVLRLITTRGDRLFLSYLGSGFIFFGWVFFFSSSLLWLCLVLCLCYSFFVFKKV